MYGESGRTFEYRFTRRMTDQGHVPGLEPRLDIPKPSCQAHRGSVAAPYRGPPAPYRSAESRHRTQEEAK